MTERERDNVLGFHTLLLLAIVLLLAWQVFHQPQTSGRFQPFRDISRMALDTKTGKLCLTVPSPASGDSQLGVENEPRIEIPVCSDLQ